MLGIYNIDAAIEQAFNDITESADENGGSRYRSI